MFQFQFIFCARFESLTGVVIGGCGGCAMSNLWHATDKSNSPNRGDDGVWVSLPSPLISILVYLYINCHYGYILFMYMGTFMSSLRFSALILQAVVSGIKVLKS